MPVETAGMFGFCMAFRSNLRDRLLGGSSPVIEIGDRQVECALAFLLRGFLVFGFDFGV